MCGPAMAIFRLSAFPTPSSPLVPPCFIAGEAAYGAALLARQGWQQQQQQLTAEQKKEHL